MDRLISKNISFFESLCEATKTRFYAILGEGEIRGAVPDIGWDLYYKADED
jgi:hypothetical protein